MSTIADIARRSTTADFVGAAVAKRRAAADLIVVQSFSTEGGPDDHRSLGTQWLLRDGDLIETASRIVDRDLTEQEWAKYIGDGVPCRATCQ